MILEGVVTTTSEGGGVNIAPMGPIVELDPAPRHAGESAAIAGLTLRPYRTSTTYGNLKRSGYGVFHITDDVWLLARAAVGGLDEMPEMIPLAEALTEAVECKAAARAAELAGQQILAGACRWYLFRATAIDDAAERTTIEAEILAWGRRRDFLGFHRARHAVLEAAILATRVHLLEASAIDAELARMAPWVEKTGGEAERRAWQFLIAHIKSMRKS